MHQRQQLKHQNSTFSWAAAPEPSVLGPDLLLEGNRYPGIYYGNSQRPLVVDSLSHYTGVDTHMRMERANRSSLGTQPELP